MKVFMIGGSLFYGTHFNEDFSNSGILSKEMHAAAGFIRRETL